MNPVDAFTYTFVQVLAPAGIFALLAAIVMPILEHFICKED